MHRHDPEGFVSVPCDTRTWTAWLTDDPSRMTADDMELMLSVITVQSSYTLEPCLLARAAAGYLALNFQHVACQGLCLQFLRGDWFFFC
jgi:hypothetical protein